MSRDIWHSPPPPGAPKTIWPAVLMAVGLGVAAGGAILFLNIPIAVGTAAALGLVPGLALLIAILRYPFVGLLLIFFFTYVRPQDIVTALRPLHLPMLSTAGLFALAVFNIVRNRDKSVLWPGGMTIFTLILALMAIGVITSVNNYWAFQYFRDMVLMAVFVFLIVNLVTTSTEMRRVIGLMVAAHAYFCLKGLGQFAAGNVFGTTGTVGSGFLGDENDFALALIVMFPFVFFSIQRSKSGARRFLWTALSLLVLLTTMATMSRGGFVGMAVTLFVCWVMSANKIRNAAVLLFLILVVAVAAPKRYMREIESIRNTGEGTADLRVKYWRAGLKMYAEHPLIGVGQGNSGALLPIYMDVPDANTKWGRAMHGTIPLLLAELGTIGFLLYAAFFFQTVWYVRRMVRYPIDDPDERVYARYLSQSTFAAMLGFLACSAFLSALYYPHLYILAGIAMAGERIAATAAQGGLKT